MSEIDKTKAEQVAELVGAGIATYDCYKNILVMDCVQVSYFMTPFIDLEDNPNTAEAIENALRVLSGEVVEVKLKTVYVAYVEVPYEFTDIRGIFNTKQLALELMRKEFPNNSDAILLQNNVVEYEVEVEKA